MQSETHNTAGPVLPADDMALVPIELTAAVSGIKRTAIYARGKLGAFPTPLRLSYRCSRWRAGDIRRWLHDPFGWAPSMAIDARREAARNAEPIEVTAGAAL